MNEQAATSAGLAKHIEGNDMFGSDGARIAFRLDQPCRTVDHDLTVYPAIASVSSVAHHLVTPPLETLQQKLFEGERVHRSQPGIKQLGRLQPVAAT